MPASHALSYKTRILFFFHFWWNLRARPPWFRAGSDRAQTLRGSWFGPMKMLKCPKFSLSAFTLGTEVQRMLPSKEFRWQHF